MYYDNGNNNRKMAYVRIQRFTVDFAEPAQMDDADFTLSIELD